MSKKTFLFTTTHCPKCPAAKEFMKENNIEHQIIEVDTVVEGRALANLYKVMTVPSIVEIYADGKSINYTFEEYKQNKNDKKI